MKKYLTGFGIISLVATAAYLLWKSKESSRKEELYNVIEIRYESEDRDEFDI